MRLVTFAPSAPAAARVGVLDGSDVVDLTAACRSYVAKPRHRLQPVRPPAPPRQGQITRNSSYLRHPGAHGQDMTMVPRVKP